MNLNQTWRDAKTLLETKINRQGIEAWFNPLSIKDINGNKVTILAPNKFFSDWLKDHYYDVICEVLSSVTGIYDLKIDFYNKDDKEMPQKEELVEDKAGAIIEDKTLPTVKNSERKRLLLNPKYTFNTFVVGSSNQFAQAACYAVAQSPEGHITRFSCMAV